MYQTLRPAAPQDLGGETTHRICFTSVASRATGPTGPLTAPIVIRVGTRCADGRRTYPFNVLVPDTRKKHSEPTTSCDDNDTSKRNWPPVLLQHPT